MKYSELISFHPIEDVIQLTTADDAGKAKEYVKTYVMSDQMAENLKAPVIEQLQMNHVVDNHGVLIVGNYGTGKSHLMSVLSAIATDASNLKELQNQTFAEEAKCIAGKFEVLRVEIGGVTMSLREILFGFIKDDFDKRGISFDVPDFSNVKDNKRLIKDMMMAFAEVYPDKGYLIVVDEFLSYLTSRNERQIVLDLEFLRALGEMCSKSKLRVIFGVQEKIFDNPKFSFVSETLKHVSDRFTQLVITKEDTSYVVSERILKKTPEQKAMIRKHLERFSNLYTGMSSRMEEFVDLFPIHPAYIDVFNKVYLIENRHILKNISTTIRGIFHQDVPEDAPGIISFDNYWPAIKNNGLLKSDPTISRVVSASGQLEDILQRSFPKKTYQAMAIQIVYALSVHRLTTNGLDVQYGLTAENLKDDLCLFLSMPSPSADFLLGVVQQTLRDIMTTVSGQFIVQNDANGQFFIDVNKIVDYDEKIHQKASILAPGEMNRHFYKIVYDCLEWDERQYVPGFEIYEYDLNWKSHNFFREGYLFLGLPGERSTAQPERDFYIHIMPPYGNDIEKPEALDDEVYLFFKTSDDFTKDMSMYAAACEMAATSEGKDKEAYQQKAGMFRKKLVRYLGENKNTCFDVVYQQQRKRMIEVLKGSYLRDSTFKDTIDLAASICLDGCFQKKYPQFPVFQTKITRKNMAENAAAAIDYFAGRKNSQPAVALLKSFGVLDGDKIRPENSKYAGFYIDQLKKLPPQGVLNYSDMFEAQFNDWQIDKTFKIPFLFTPIIFLSLVYAGYAVLTLDDGARITASDLEKIPKMGESSFYEFKYLSKPAQMSMAELKRLFEILDINPTYLDNPKDREKGVGILLKQAQQLCNTAVQYGTKLDARFDLWGEPMAASLQISTMETACGRVKEEFENYDGKFNTPAKLHNFCHSMDEVNALDEQIEQLRIIPEYFAFKNECHDIVDYIARIEAADLGEAFQQQVADAKGEFRKIRDSIANGTKGEAAARKVTAVLEKVKARYIDLYMEEHARKRLDLDDAKRKGKLQESKELATLKKLRNIDILSTVKLQAIEKDLSGLQVCYELSPSELQKEPVCPHCHYQMGSHAKSVHGQLDSIETRITDLVTEWTATLYQTVSDPLVLGQKQFLKPQQQKVIDQFVQDKTLPKRVDDFFVQSIKDLLKGFEPVVIDTDELVSKLDEIGPCDVDTFEAKIKALVRSYIEGKDPSKLRIVVKRQEA